MAVIDGGNDTAGKVNVTSAFELPVALTQSEAISGFAGMIVEQDEGSATGSRLMRSPILSLARRQKVGLDGLMFSDYFNAAAQNTALWRHATTTLTWAQTAGYMTFNNAANTAAGASVVSSYRQVPLHFQSPLVCDLGVMLPTTIPPSNWQFDFGLFAVTIPLASTYGPLDGGYFRLNSTGLYGVLNSNGTETVSSLLIPAASLLVAANVTYRIILGAEFTEFWATDGNGKMIYLGRVATPAGNGSPSLSSALPISFRLNQSGVTSSAVQVKVSGVSVVQTDLATNKPWSHVMASGGFGAYQGQDGHTMGSTALYTNSLAAGAGVAATNTTAALGAGLGGQFAVQPTLAAGSDGIISSYQNPVGSVAITPRTLFITGVSIQGLVTTALTGGPVLYAYSLAFGHTAVSLATAEAIGAKAARRIALGYETYVVTAAVGVLGQGVSRKFDSPVVVNPGEFIQVVAKNQGTVTSAGVIAILVTFDGYFE